MAQPVAGGLTGRSATAVWAVTALGVCLIIASAMVPTGASNDGYALIVAGLLLAGVVASFGVVGAIIAVRLPRNPIGWILWTSGAVISLLLSGVTCAAWASVALVPVPPGAVLAAVLANLFVVPLLAGVGIFLPLLFPDGRVASPGWRWVVRGSLVSVAIATALFMAVPGPLNGTELIQNPLGVPALAGLGESVSALVLALLGVPVILAASSVVIRYRRGGPILRQQVKWFAMAIVLMAVSVFAGVSGLGPLGDGNWILMYTGIVLIPIAVGVAVLRYRLYELDRVVSRTITYALVTLVLGATFVAVVLVFQAVLAPVTRENTVAVAASTLVAATLFQPVRRSISRVVDRRFDRARYDGERTHVQFSARLRNEADPSVVAQDLVATVDRAVRPSSVRLWTRDRA